MLRRGVILCMVVLLAFQSVGYYVAFVVQVGLHKAWAREQVEEGDAETLAFLTLTNEAYEGLVWAGEMEFWHEGVLHDLKVATQAEDGSWRVMCMRDEQETRLLANATEWMEKGQSENESEPETSDLFELGPCLLPLGMEMPVASLNAARFAEQELSARDWVRGIVSPPPQGVFGGIL